MTVDEMEDYCARLEREAEERNVEIKQLRAFLKAISERSDEQRHIKAQAEIERLREALERLITDCMQSDFNEHWDTFKNAEAVLAGKELT